MRKRLAETHGTGFELLRHFLRRFFDSDLITERGQWAGVLIGSFSLLLTMFLVMIPALQNKYAVLSQVATPEVYGHIQRADQLWLITLGMAAIGLLTAVKWQSLFPGLRDYLALGALPVRARQIFAAKLTALLLIVSAAVFTINLLPGIVFPALSAGPWRFHPSLAANIGAHAAACVLAAYFFFFALVGVQGVLLNVLPRRWFASATVYAQGLFIAMMLALMVLSFSIDQRVEKAVTAPPLARWLPPVWFLGLYQALAGNPDAGFHQLGSRALAASGIALAATLASYALSYHRHRALLVEGAGVRGKERRLGAILLEWISPDPREQAILSFMVKTLARGAQHRLVLIGYAGFAAAVAASGVFGWLEVTPPARAVVTCFVYAHVVLAMFVLIGVRQLFAIPIELRANWLFQLVERDGRGAWLNAIDRFVLGGSALLFVAVPFPLEASLAGWHAVPEAVLACASGLLGYEILFLEWEKVPFTCSYLPGKQPAWIKALQLLGLLATLPFLTAVFTAACYSLPGFVIVMSLLLGVRSRVHHAREVAWAGVRLTFEDKPEPAVRGLGLTA